ncbi:DDE-type integrase/transposase/recombinase [Verrucomicrobiota bacterium]
MPNNQSVCGGDERWAQFRFSVIGPLLAAPPEAGELRGELKRLAAKNWRHPITGQWTLFGASTIERWYYRALREPRDPVGVLARKIREDSGTHPSMSIELREALHAQYKEHPDWSYQLHADNLRVLAKENPVLGSMPSYVTLRRYMKRAGLIKRKRRGRGHTAGVIKAEKRFEDLEIRSYESEYVNALWHLDFHSGRLKVLDGAEWVVPRLLGMLDDHSRLCCHAQWYFAETAENLVHGLCQSFEKRGLPRALMTDNGSAMTATETVQGLARLGIHHEATLPYSPYQNGKQEVFWAQVEGRLVAMLSGCRDLTLAQLNEATLAWFELEYNRKVHSELRCAPLKCFIHDRDVGRPCPGSEALRTAFTEAKRRTQRRSDGTISVESVRFELPSRYRHLTRVTVRYASWDLSDVYMADERTGRILCRIYPLDKHKNADGRRRRKEPIVDTPERQVSGGIAPLLRKLIADYAATGLPPAYLPKDEITEEEKDNE